MRVCDIIRIKYIDGLIFIIMMILSVMAVYDYCPA